MDKDFATKYATAQNRDDQHRWALAGLANKLLWLGWLRSMETFGRKWSDLDVIKPKDGPSHDLPRNIGAILIDLGVGTKTERGHRRRVVIAYECLSGLSLGKWIQRAYCTSGGVDMTRDDKPIFTTTNGTIWTSRHFRKNYLYPSLVRQREEGDSFLRAFDDRPGNTLEDKFWSLHCYRRGARTHATKSGKVQSRKATKDQVYEHGRWRRRRASEPIDKQYDAWSLQDRLKITLFCH
jgi:hypothetical protein